MNQIIKAALETHTSEYSIEDWEEKIRFEHFINRCVVNKYSLERFDPVDIMTGDGEIGLDGIAILLNGHIVTTLSETKDYYDKNSNIEVTFVFIQAKRSDSFVGGEISTFFRGIKHFFEPEEERPATNDKIEELIRAKDYIFTEAVNQGTKPIFEAYYACCGTWNTDNNLTNCVQTECKYFENTADYQKVTFVPADSDKIITLYKELRRKISKTIMMQKKMPFYSMNGIVEAYFGLVSCKDIVQLLQDDNGNLFSNIFEDNVRDFQGYNAVNNEIKATVFNKDAQERFAVLNNGITIITKEIKPSGDNITIFDYQIVNGCQTSRVLFDNRTNLTDNSYVLVRVVQVADDATLEDIVYTTNRQTEVKSEAFASSKKFHKKLEEYYKSVDIDTRLYYERRSKQYDKSEGINKNKVITLATQIFSYISFFLNEPQSANSRYYGEILNTYKDKMFSEESLCEPYYISAFALYLVDDAIRRGIIDKRWKDYKYHLIYAIRVLCVGNKIFRSNSREMKRSCETLYLKLADRSEFKQLLKTACSCFDEAVKQLPQVDKSLIKRSKVVTDRLTEIVSNYLTDKSNMMFLERGNIVPCIVTAINDYSITVELRTDDERNRGSIHISRIAKRWIEDIYSEFKIGETIQAKILNDNYFETSYGWKLTTIF
ncbi:S1 RNA-binding domain-containing protein [Lacrimispora amygdalina]|uniref:S1 RNA-binding domain-containing protein n=1 Tax=Lacrimispora amygdalina TaxID=253257 RepID=A0A3E2NCW9_9FIRM|nr:AIPR family protein [Clostridium indicum]RFZ78813.1 S1 RNA-binding domain-containing protein [Clostridium indicum]